MSPGIRSAKLVEASWMVNQLFGVIYCLSSRGNTCKTVKHRTLPTAYSSESVDVALTTDTHVLPKYKNQ